MFDLGPMTAGDTVRVAVRRISPSLRPGLALFDDQRELVAEDTLTSVDFPNSDPVIEHVARADSASLFVALSHTFASVSIGGYEVDVRITRNGAPPVLQNQVVRLTFDGGTVNDPVFGEVEVGPFDAGEIAAEFADDTELFKSIILQTMVENYARFDITFVSSDEADTLTGAYSEVVFGGFSVIAFGAAEAVDAYNQDRSDRAIIFTGAFEPALFGIAPSAEDMAVAVGNVAAHELGHLLGLNHVNDPTALMDQASPAFTLMDDQEFKSASLSDSIFPLGWHDSADLLSVTLGPTLDAKRVPRATLAPRPRLRTDVLTLKKSSIGKCANCMIRRGLGKPD